MCEASHMKFAPVCHQILQVYMYENVTYGPSQNGVLTSVYITWIISSFNGFLGNKSFKIYIKPKDE